VWSGYEKYSKRFLINFVCILCYSYSAFLYIQYINQQNALSKIQ